MSFAVDLERGGRWTDLTLAGRQWLWRRDDPARATVRPDDPFVDAGGIEECLPTIRGVPDHGAIWSRRWTALGDERSCVETEDFWLGRVIRGDDDAVTATYRLQAEAGYRFVWAAHALLELSDGAVVHVPAGFPVRMYDLPGTGPGWVAATWPECSGVPMSRLGPVDGTATGAIVVGAGKATVIDRGRALDLAVTCAGAPVSVALWRNLGGFPEGRPYRSIGVEPMLGAVFDRHEARVPGDVAIVPGSGELTWELTLRARWSG